MQGRTHGLWLLPAVSGALLVGALLAGASGAAAIRGGATSCHVDYRAASRNLDCRAAVPGGSVTLSGRLSILEPAVAGAPTRFAYDAAGRLVRAEGPAGAHAYTYDDLGRLLARTDAGGETARYAYDGAGRLVAAGDTALAYAGDALVRTVAGDGTATTYTYDSRGNLLSAADDPGTTIRFVYDKHALVVSAAAGGRTVEYAYDRRREPVRRTSAGATTSYEYDSHGELRRSSDGSGQTVTYTYGRDEELLAVAGAEGTARLAYDQAGRPVAFTAPDGSTIAFAYDDGGRLLSILPEVGDEVLVGFEQGDLNEPYVVGLLYGDAERPPESFGATLVLTTSGLLLTCERCP